MYNKAPGAGRWSEKSFTQYFDHGRPEIAKRKSQYRQGIVH